MTNITMYNMQFGECIKIERNNRVTILSDFGSNWAREDIKNTYNKVIKDIRGTRIDVYISHFHKDHIDGFLYALSQKARLNINRVIFPDINNFSIIKGLISEIVFQCIIEQTWVSKKPKVSLWDLINFFHVYMKDVIFVHRGDKIDGNTILWPDKNQLIKISTQYIKGYHNNFFQIITKKYNFALDEYVNECVYLILKIFNKEFDEKVNTELKAKIKDLENTMKNFIFDKKELMNFLKELDNQEFMNKIEQIINDKEYGEEELDFILSSEPLNKIGHEICLVFHNAVDGNENYIFTGDINKKNLENILNNKDKNPKCKIHEKYKYFKVPHHGTNAKKYALSFDKYLSVDSFLIISNGKKLRRIVKRGAGTLIRRPSSNKTWCIDPFYYRGMYLKINHFCSNTNNCIGHYKKSCCACKKHITINSDYKNSI